MFVCVVAMGMFILNKMKTTRIKGSAWYVVGMKTFLTTQIYFWRSVVSTNGKICKYE